MEVFLNHMRKRTQKVNPTNLDMSLWVHLFSFDCLGELNISKMFGFMEGGEDFEGMIEASDRELLATGLVSRSSVFSMKGTFLKPTSSMHKLRCLSGSDGSRKIIGIRNGRIPY